MATQRATSGGPRGDPGAKLPDPVPDRLPFARAASVIAVIVLAGALFGYDQGVISGALLGVQKAFAVGAAALEIVTSWVTLGAMFGSLGGGYVADHFGRKRALFAAAALFIIGAAVEALSPNVPVLVFGRLVAGFGVGVAAVAAPLYAAELAPTAQRGRFVSSYQLAITIGIFLAYFVDQALAGPEGWRAMFAVSAVAGVLLAVAVLTAVESPRWLVKTGRPDDARRNLVALGAEDDADARLAAIKAALRAEHETASWSDVFAPRWRTPLKIGLGLAVLQQITGINAIIYYSDNIFAAAGFTTPAAQTAATTWAIGAVNVLSTFIAIAFIDRLGRRPLLIAGLIGMGLSLAAVGFAFKQSGGAGGDDRSRHAGRARRVHHLVRILPRPGDLDGHQRDLSRRGARQGGCGGDCGQLGRGVPGQRILPLGRQCDRPGLAPSGCSRPSAPWGSSGSMSGCRKRAAARSRRSRHPGPTRAPAPSREARGARVNTSPAG